MLRPDWREVWLARLEAEPWLAPRWAACQERGAYWRHGSICEDYGRMTVPILVIAGWADNYMNTVATIVEKIPGSKGIVGPWVHQYPHTAVPGPRVGFLALALRWWDRWLKGIENGAEADPAYRFYMLDSEPPNASPAVRAGHWVAEQDWPSARVSRQVLGLSSFAPTPGGFTPLGPFVGYLSQNERRAISGVISSPQHLGMNAGEFFPMGLNAEMPGDQRADDALSLCFDGDVLVAPLDLLGAARLTLRLTSDKPLGFVVARLCDVAPDGASVRIAHGMFNLCHHASREAPTPLVPGEEIEVSFAIDQMAYRLAAGHRLRLALSNSYWPFVWPSPEAGVLTVLEGQLDLPVHEGPGAEWQPPPAETASPWKHRVVRGAKTSRVVEADLITGLHSLVIKDDLGDVENLTHGLITGETMSELWQISAGDPTSARAVHVWEQRLSRGDWTVRTRAEAEMSCTATHLRMQARLTAWEWDTIVFERDWDDRVERRFV
jgi:predicted acyl esterase